MPKCDFDSNFIEIILRHWCPPVNLLHIFRTPFPKSTSKGCFYISIAARLYNSKQERRGTKSVCEKSKTVEIV